MLEHLSSNHYEKKQMELPELWSLGFIPRTDMGNDEVYERGGKANELEPWRDPIL